MENSLDLTKIAQNSKIASSLLTSLSTNTKNEALLTLAEYIKGNEKLILLENKKDLENAEILIKNGELSRSLYNRLVLDTNKIDVIAMGIRDVAKLNDPTNKILWAMKLDDGLELRRVSCPIGVIGIIFESRPDVVPQIASLSIKSGNAIILKGGKEAYHSNRIFIKIINDALSSIKNFPKNIINMIETREDVNNILKLENYIDLIIPRGSNKLVKYIQENTKIPVLGHTEGICHIYIDEFADLDKATKIAIDSKIQYPSACNSVETILIHKNLVDNYLEKLISELIKNNVVVKGDEICQKKVPQIEIATEKDWSTEYSDKIVSIKVVDYFEDAITHINTYGSGHTDCIVTEDKSKIEFFMNTVDSAGVYHNASTRFADGFRYGLGAEVGISTNKTHARGPVGLEGLVSYKYKLYGQGQIVADYSGDNAKPFIHKRLK